MSKNNEIDLNILIKLKKRPPELDGLELSQ